MTATDVIPDFSPPEHIIRSEMIVAGAAMTSAKLAEQLGDLVRPEHFRKAGTSIVFGATLALAEAGKPVDPVALLAELTRSGDLAAAGGANFVHDCMAAGVVPEPLWHAREVCQDYARRLAAGSFTTALDYLTSPQFDPEDGFDRVRSLVDAALNPAQARDALPSMADVFAEVVDDLDSEGPRGIPTPWIDLNEVIGGLMAGEMITVAGRTGSGKSLGLLGIAAHAAIRLGIPSLIASMEMTRTEVMTRLIAAEGAIPLHILLHRRLDTEHWDRIQRVRERICSSPLLIDDSPDISLAHLRSRLRGMSRTAAAGLLCVDYIGLLTSPDRAENRQNEVAAFSRGLKRIAGEFRIPVVAAAQLNRLPEHRGDKRPQASDLRESGCMPASTRLMRADTGEEVTLGDLLLSQEPAQVLSLNAHWKLVPSTLTKAFPSGIKPVFRLRMASGREVDATANHKFLTVTGWVPLGDLPPGSFVAVPRRHPVPTDTVRCDEDELILMAHLLGDGSIGPGVKYATADPANKAAVERAAMRRFGITVAGEKRRNTWQLWLPSPYPTRTGRNHPVRNWLEPLGLWLSRSGDKFLPEHIFRLPDDQLALFMRHLWATDGSIFVGGGRSGEQVRIYYASTSRRLAEHVRRALLRFEIRTVIYPTRKAGYSISWHVVVASAPDQQRFLQLIGCHGERGEKVLPALRALGRIKTNPNADLVPWPVAAQVKAAMATAGISHRQLATGLGETYCGSYMLGCSTRPRRFARDRLARMAEVTASQSLTDLATSDVFWDEVVEITPLGPMPVFDATVPETQNFVANGVIAHNSIENDSSVVILMHRPDLTDIESPRAGEIDFIVDKNRHGPRYTVTQAFQGHYARVVDMAATLSPTRHAEDA